MENHIKFISLKPYYFEQLCHAKTFMLIKNYQGALDIQSKIIEYLHQDLQTLGETYFNKIHLALNLCHTLRQYSYFEWLIFDNETFCQHKELHVNELQDDCSTILLYNNIYHPGENEQSIQLKLDIINLLFESDFSQSSLTDLKQNFCALHDVFQQKQDFVNQSLVLLGLSLVNIYNSCSDAYQGLELVTTTNPLLDNLVYTIRCQLPILTQTTITETMDTLTNPLTYFRLTRTLTASNFKL